MRKIRYTKVHQTRSDGVCCTQRRLLYKTLLIPRCIWTFIQGGKDGKMSTVQRCLSFSISDLKKRSQKLSFPDTSPYLQRRYLRDSTGVILAVQPHPIAPTHEQSICFPNLIKRFLDTVIQNFHFEIM